MPPEIKVLEADMLDLPFDDQCFDVVIEKGTMVDFILLSTFILLVSEFFLVNQEYACC